MKKTLVVLAIVASMVATMACGGAGKFKSDIDSLSYAIGADLGLNIRFSVEDLDLDQAMVADNLKDFLKNGDIESEEFMQEMQQMQMFQYTKFMPYMQAAMMHERSERTDTLPALPELYDEEFKREDIARYIGHSMAANVKGANIDLVMPFFNEGFNDGLNVESEEKIEEGLRITMEEMQNVFRAYGEKMAAQQEAEFEAKLKENTEASAKWLKEVEQMEGVKKSESGLLYRIDREGEGKKATKDTDVVLVNYEGKVRSGEIFDSSYERGEPISFALNQVIKGWTEGMKYVNEGGQITLWIPAELAYGDQDKGTIGPGDALEFKVELLEVNPKNK